MGSLLSNYQSDQSGFYIPDRSLENQTFNIHGQKYTLRERLGGGAFGSVWSAVAADGSSAAIKAIDVSGRTTGGGFDPVTLAESFEKEIKMAYKMRKATRHVVTIYGFDFDPRTGLALMAMELGGDSLAKRIEVLHMRDMRRRHYHRDGTVSASKDYISPRERKNIWVQLVNIVQALNQHRVVHRDMKPDNLVFFGPIMKIVDLGIAQKEIAGNPNGDGIGTPFYSAPECFETGTNITSKADIWSAGAILYTMTYGGPPVYNSPIPPSTSYPTRSTNVKDVLHRCLEYDLHRRGSHRWLAHHPYTKNPTAL